MAQQQAVYDELQDWERELAMEYGLNKTLAVLRAGRGKKYARQTLATRHGKPVVRRRK